MKLKFTSFTGFYSEESSVANTKNNRELLSQEYSTGSFPSKSNDLKIRTSEQLLADSPATGSHWCLK